MIGTTRRAALGLIVSGAALLGAETQSFSGIDGNRTLDVAIASDDNAYLGLSGFDGNVVYDEPQEVTITNQTGGPLTGTNEVRSANGKLRFREPGTTDDRNPLTLPDLADGASDSFEIVTASGESGNVTDTVTIAVGEPGAVSIEVTRSITVESNVSASIVYAKNEDLFVYDAVDDVERDPPDNGQVGAIGGQAADLKGDTDADLPYVYKKGIRATEIGGPDTEILSNNKLKLRKTRLAVGNWPTDSLSNPVVFYATKNKNELRATDGSGTQETIARPGDGVGAVGGPADIDDDGTDELVYMDGSQNLQYIEQDGTNVDIGRGVGSNNSAGFGPPADFVGDGVPRIPIVDGSNQVALVDVNGNKEVLTGGTAKKAAVAPGDPDVDGEYEVLFLGSDTGNVRYVDDVGSSNVVDTLSVEGSPVSPDDKAGVNSGTDFVG